MYSPSNQDLVSIGMTCYNGERWIAKTLDSLLAQEYKNFELVISDNASQDRTGDICTEYSRKDSRIKYSRNNVDIGPNNNSIKVINACTGYYMVFVSDHDMYHPQFLSHLIEEFKKDESVVLCYPRTVNIDADDNVIELSLDILDTRGLSRTQRYKKIIWEFAIGNMICGLFKMSVIRKVWRTINVIGPDHILMGDISLLGNIAQINEELYFRRYFRPNESWEDAQKRYIQWFVKSKFEKIVPWTMMAYEHIKAIMDADLEPGEKEFLFEEVRKCFPTRFKSYFLNEAEQLKNEISKAASDTTGNHVSRDVAGVELARLEAICHFFSNEIKKENTTGSSPMGNKPNPFENTNSVSVIIPTYNREKLIEHAVRSIQAQTVPVNEIIIIDDASSDNTSEIVNRLITNDTRIKYIRLEKNSGAQVARNTGIKNATCEWVSFLDSDDIWLPKRIENALKTAKDKNVAVVYSNYIKREVDGSEIACNPPKHEGMVFEQLLKGSFISFPGLFVKRKCFVEIGFLDESIKSWQEWDTGLMLSKLYRFGYDQLPGFIWIWHDGETISKDNKRELVGYLQIVLKYKNDILNLCGEVCLEDHLNSVLNKINALGQTDDLTYLKNQVLELKYRMKELVNVS